MPDEIMKTLDPFVSLVEDMRKAQKAYFHCRDSYNLRVAKEFEKRVDQEIILIRNGHPPEQSNLFDLLAQHPDTRLVPEAQCNSSHAHEQ